MNPVTSVNVIYDAPDPICLLSNLAHTPFVFRGIQFASVEGLIQGMKEENPERQNRIFQTFGHRAKRASSAKRNARVQESGNVFLQNEPISFLSDQYFTLIAEAIFEKFQQNPDALAALVSTGDACLVHDTGKPEKPTTALPADRFTAILTKIREKAR